MLRGRITPVFFSSLLEGFVPNYLSEESLLIFLPDFLDWRVPLPALPKALPASSAYNTTYYLLLLLQYLLLLLASTAGQSCYLPANTTYYLLLLQYLLRLLLAITPVPTTTTCYYYSTYYYYLLLLKHLLQYLLQYLLLLLLLLAASAGQSWAGQHSGLGCLYFPQTPTRRLEYYLLTILIPSPLCPIPPSFHFFPHLIPWPS